MVALPGHRWLIDAGAAAGAALAHIHSIECQPARNDPACPVGSSGMERDAAKSPLEDA
jgi:hypothetical protein